MDNLHGAVCFSMGRTLFSRLIGWFTKAPISHTMVGFLDDLVVEATIPKVEISRFSKYRKRRIKSFEVYALVKPNEKVDLAIHTIINKYLDTKYSWSQLFGYVWVYLVRKVLGKAIRNPFDKTATLVCGELVLNYLKLLGFRDKDLQAINIEEAAFMDQLYDYVKTSKRFTLIYSRGKAIK